MALLKEKLKIESEARLTASEQVQSLEKSHTKLTQEHSDLKKEMEEHEENWKEQLENTQNS